MTALSICQEAAAELNLGSLPAVYSGTTPTAIVMQAVLNSAADDVLKAHDWANLITTLSLTGNDVDEFVELPEDFDRITPTGAELYIANRSTTSPLVDMPDLIAWNRATTYDTTFIAGRYQFRGTRFLRVLPIMEFADTLLGDYVSNYLAIAGGVAKRRFTLDSDTTYLDETLLKYAVKWRYRKQKGLDYAEDMADYNTRLMQVTGTDYGKSVVVVGQVRSPIGGAEFAYPGMLG